MRMVISAFSFLLLLVVSSCQREPGIILDDVNPPAGSDSILLQKYVELDTTFPSGSDTSWKVTYTYDSRKRIKNAFYVFPELFTPVADTSNIDYYYSGNDSLPFMYVMASSESGVNYIDSVFLTYNSGLVSKDSTITYNISTPEFLGTSVKVFTTTGNNTFLQRREYALPAPVFDQWSGTLFKTHQNGNITVQDDTTAGLSVAPDRKHCIVSYDNKINPFYRAEIPYPVLNKWKIQKNNVIEETSWDIPSFIQSHYLYSYTYRADGYPLIVRLTDPSGTFGDKGFFYYTR